MPLNAAFRSLITRAALLVVLVMLTVNVFAQSQRTITLGTSIVGQIEEDAPAQVYTYTATAGEVFSVAVTSEAGLALTLTVTDAAGNLLATSTDTTAVGGVSVVNVSLSEGINYVTVFAAAGVTTNTVGAFRLVAEGEGGGSTTEQPVIEATNAPDNTSPTAETPTDTAAATPEPVVTEAPANVEYTVGSVLTSAGINVSLTWASTADLNLELRDPEGERLFFDSTTNTNGGRFGFDANGLCANLTADAPTETATYSAGAIPTGYYEILVYYREDCDNNGAQDFTLNVSVDGVPVDTLTGNIPGENQGVYITSFLVNNDGTAQMSPDRGLYGDVRSLTVPAAEIVAAVPVGELAFDTPVRGTLAGETYFQTYKFTGVANDIVALSMTRISGNLDTLLLVLDPNGQIVADNDDIVAGNVTDSAINNPPLRLAVDGTYTVMATRYGKQFGGTAGQYELVMSSQGADLPQDVIDLGLPTGDVQVTLVWNSNHDLQLLVRDPAGIAVFEDEPTIASGGRMTQQGNVNCVAPLVTPVSHIYWPTGLGRGGNYEIEVWHQNNCNDTRPVTATLYISVYGQTIGTIPITTILNQRFITSFTIDGNRNVSLGLGGITGGSETIDFAGQIDSAIPLTFGQSVTGNITLEDKFQVYTFEGTAGQVIDISMIATQGTLDPNLFLISPSLFEVANNDDITPGEETDSFINDFELPETGRYIVLATHYGTIYGATVGSYQLTVTQQ